MRRRVLFLCLFIAFAIIWFPSTAMAAPEAGMVPITTLASSMGIPSDQIQQTEDSITIPARIGEGAGNDPYRIVIHGGETATLTDGQNVQWEIPFPLTLVKDGVWYAFPDEWYRWWNWPVDYIQAGEYFRYLGAYPSPGGPPWGFRGKGYGPDPAYEFFWAGKRAMFFLPEGIPAESADQVWECFLSWLKMCPPFIQEAFWDRVSAVAFGHFTDGWTAGQCAPDWTGYGGHAQVGIAVDIYYYFAGGETPFSRDLLCHEIAHALDWDPSSQTFTRYSAQQAWMEAIYADAGLEYRDQAPDTPAILSVGYDYAHVPASHWVLEDFAQAAEIFCRVYGTSISPGIGPHRLALLKQWFGEGGFIYAQ